MLNIFQRSVQNPYCGIILSNVDFLSVLRAAWCFSSSKGSELSYPASSERKGPDTALTGLWLSESGSTNKYISALSILKKLNYIKGNMTGPTYLHCGSSKASYSIKSVYGRCPDQLSGGWTTYSPASLKLS